jgi:hypothetical protein
MRLAEIGWYHWFDPGTEPSLDFKDHLSLAFAAIGPGLRVFRREEFLLQIGSSRFVCSRTGE